MLHHTKPNQSRYCRVYDRHCPTEVIITNIWEMDYIAEELDQSSGASLECTTTVFQSEVDFGVGSLSSVAKGQNTKFRQ